VIYRFTVGRLSCAVVSDGQMTPPWEPPLAEFFIPAAGVPDDELHAALAAEGRHRTTLSCGYNCVLVQTSNGHAVIDTGLGARFLVTDRPSSRWPAGSAPGSHPLGRQLPSWPRWCSPTCIRTTAVARPGQAS
jgi:hypothetical protein